MKITTIFLLTGLTALLTGCTSAPEAGSLPASGAEGSSAQSSAGQMEENYGEQAERLDPVQPSKLESIPFSDNQLYAAAYVGYEGHLELDDYAERYLDSEEVPVHYFSPWEYYLIIPRYPDMSLALYKNDIQTDQPTLVYRDPDCEPFLIQCNISDIFSDVTVELTYQGETVSFSPYLSLKDGSVQIGERGLNLTQ